MSARLPLKSTVSSTIIQKKVSKTIIQDIESKKNIKQCLKLLENGELHLSDIDDIKEELIMKPQLGDQIQYQLHKYCQKDLNKTNADLVVKLAELCYSYNSVSQFSYIDRFVGCVYYITSYLLKKEKYNSALDIIYKLLIKKDEILKHSEKVSDIKTFLCNLHSSFIASAVVLASKIQSQSDQEYQISQNLAKESLKIFKLIDSEQPEIGKKVIKTATLYFQTIKHYNDEDILQFYKILIDVLKILLPKLETSDYLLYYLHKINQFKKSDSGAESHQTLKKTVHLIMLFLNSSILIEQIFNKMLNFFWNKSLPESWITDGDLGVLKKHCHSKVYFILFSHIFSYGMQLLWKKFDKNWNENISTGLVQKLLKSVLEFHKSHYGISELYCSSTKDSFEACFGDLLVGNLQKIQYTVRLCLKNKVSYALSLVPVSGEAFRFSMDSLDFMNARGCCQEQRLYFWKFSIIHHRNTVEDICRLPPTEKTWLYLKEFSSEILKQIINSNTELPFDFKSVNILFHRWHRGSLRLKNFYDALYACVVYYAFYPNEEKEIMSMWLQTKSESSNEIFEEITMSEIFKTYDKNLREFSKTYNGSSFFLKSVLLMELKAYSTCPPDTFQNPNTSYNLASRIWKQLEKCNLNLWETSVAVSSLISTNVVGDNERLLNNLHEKCKELINDLLNWRRDGKAQCRSLLHAANLTFSLFLYNVKMAENSEGKMDTTHMVLGYLKKAEEEKVKFGEDVDLNLTCDIIPSSSHLTVELETNYLNELNKIVDLWNNALKNDLSDSPTEGEFDLWLQNVKQVAYLYELFGEYKRAFTTWIMFYKIGKLCNNSGATLLGLTHLIENSTDIDKSGLKEEAELILGKLGSETTEKYIIVDYSLAVASNYLKKKKSDKCLEYLSIAKKILEGLRTAIKTYILNAKFWCLVSQFLTVYKEYEVVFDYPSGTDVRVMAFKAFSYANGGGRSDLIRSVTQSDCTELIVTMLKVNLWAYYLYGVYRQTDFMRFFLDDLYQIVQKLFLPTRTAEILVRLAEVDIICEKMSDSQGKVTKLKSILTTVSTICNEVFKTEKPTSPYLLVPQKNESEICLPRPISPARFLDKRPQSGELDTSPVHYYLNDVKTLNTTEHLKKCKCRLCHNLFIQILTMNTIWLEGDIYNMGNNLKQAAKCYSQACEVLNKLEYVRAEQSKMLRLELESVLKSPGELDFKLTFLQFHCARFLIKYALFESSSLKTVTENVTKTIFRINKLMRKFSYEEKLLQWTFTELKLFCLVLTKGDAKQSKKSTPVQLKTINIVQTPSVNSSNTYTAAVAKKDFEKLEKSPRSRRDLQNRKITFEEDKSSDDRMNTAFMETDKLKTDKRVIHPRKLSFRESETNTKTVKKVPKKKVSCNQSRKLDFDQSADLFTDLEKNESKKETIAQKRNLRPCRKPAPIEAKAKKEVKAAMKIYTDSKDDVKAKKSATIKQQTKTKKA